MPQSVVSYLVRAIALSVLMFLYYSNVHIHNMDRYPVQLQGFSAYLACLFISLPVVHLAAHLAKSFSELKHLLEPTRGTVAATLVILLLTPLGNLVWIPVPVGFPVVIGLLTARFPSFSSEAMLSIPVFAVLAYVMTCLSKPTAARPNAALEIIPLYLWMVYVAETLFFGIYYI